MHIAVDFYVQRSRQEQDKYAVEPQMGASGLAAEEEYKWGYLIIAEGQSLKPPTPNAPHSASMRCLFLGLLCWAYCPRHCSNLESTPARPPLLGRAALCPALP